MATERSRVSLTTPADLPPVNSFWSLTMYELPESLLVANPIDRTLLNSTMLDEFVRDADGGITLYLQHDSPGTAKQVNWLPAPEGPFSATMRLYWAKAEALDGRWQPPPLTPGPEGSSSARLQGVVDRCLKKDTGSHLHRTAEFRSRALRPAFPGAGSAHGSPAAAGTTGLGFQLIPWVQDRQPQPK